MFIVTASSINYYFKRRFPRYLNLTDDGISPSTNQIQTFDISYGYNTIKDVSSKFNKENFIFEIISYVVVVVFSSFNKNTN